eukprot:jgi/Ulvmu1/6417/UM003_0046.1
MHRPSVTRMQKPVASWCRGSRVAGGRARLQPVSALPFGFGRPKKVIDDEKERMWEAQQEILRARREGRGMDGVSERRAKAKAQAQEKENKKERDRQALARGERPEDDDEPYEPYGKEDAGLRPGIIIPLAPFGIPKFDNGERFDLKAPYTDQGWVDEEADPFKWAKNIFGGKKKGDKSAQAAGKEGK